MVYTLHKSTWSEPIVCRNSNWASVCAFFFSSLPPTSIIIHRTMMKTKWYVQRAFSLILCLEDIFTCVPSQIIIHICVDMWRFKKKKSKTHTINTCTYQLTGCICVHEDRKNRKFPFRVASVLKKNYCQTRFSFLICNDKKWDALNEHCQWWWFSAVLY